MCSCKPKCNICKCKQKSTATISNKNNSCVIVKEVSTPTTNPVLKTLIENK